MMFKFEVVENHSEKWDRIVKSATLYDFHHTAYYHKIDNAFTSRLLYFSHGNSYIALPIVQRPIEGTDFFDITSVYGYSGPLYYFENNDVRQDLIGFFRETFERFCSQNKIVSVFSRLHPLMEQEGIVHGLGEVVPLNRTVSVDLTITPEEQRKFYRKSLKSELNQLRRKEYRVAEAATRQEIDAFINIYFETMDRVQASSHYYFTREYFYDFLDNNSFDSTLLVAKDGPKVIAGAIFTHTKSIMQYHLAGTADNYVKEAPMKLILDEARLLADESPTASCLHLGGGVDGSDDDSLFRFKSAFSKDFRQFSVWKYIANESKYYELSHGKEVSSFFPLYRS